ncbi:MAG: DUF2851 family protein [Melioribacteraceae bacterium]
MHSASEKELYEVWTRQEYKDVFKTIDGEEISVLDPGVRCDDLPGPDFKNARIRIGNITFVGDVEIDSDYNDWKNHGHNIDSRYNKVILHLSLSNKNHYHHVYNKDGRKIPTVCLLDFINEEVAAIPQNENGEHEKGYAIKCSDYHHTCSLEIKNNFLAKLGLERFEKKCTKIYERLKELKYINEFHLSEPVITYDLSEKFHERNFTNRDFQDKNIWKQILYEQVFEALGYSKNKTQMLELARLAKIDYLNKLDIDGITVDKFEAILFHISGLIPDLEKLNEEETKQYLERLNIIWDSVRSFYDGAFMEREKWNFFRLRPQNFPTIRIIAGAKILNSILHENLIPVIAKKIIEIRNLTVLINSLRSLFVIKSDGYWQNHYVFDQRANTQIKYFVGISRSDEIIINVILPYFSVYFEVFGNAQAAKKILKIYEFYNQKSDNSLIADMASALGIVEESKRTIISQGMIELFRGYCSKNRCLECEIGKTVFN